MPELVLVKVFFLVYIGVLLLITAGATVISALQAIGVHHLSEKMKLNRPWYAFLPILNVFAIGRLGDECVKPLGKKKLAKAMVVMNIVVLVLALVLVFFAMNLGFDAAIAEETYMNSIEDNTSLWGSVIALVLVLLAVFAMSIVYIVLYYISLWRIYSSFDRTNAVLYIVLSVLFDFLPAIFLFVIRKKEYLPEFMLMNMYNEAQVKLEIEQGVEIEEEIEE